MVSDEPTQGRAQAEVPDEDGLSVECWMRLIRGSHPRLTLDWRRGRVLVTDGFIELRLEAAEVPARYEPPFDVAVALIDPDGVDQQPQVPGAPYSPPQRALLVTTTAGNQREIALHADDVEAVLAALDCPAHPEEQSEDQGWVYRTAEVVGRPSSGDDGDVITQLRSCLDAVHHQLVREGLSVADIRDVTVRSTDFPATRAQASALGSWLRQVGAAQRVCFVDVEELPVRGQVVEVEVSATGSTWVGDEGPPVFDPDDCAPVPEHLRPALRAELDALVRGERPEMLYEVELYGEDGARLVVQPEEVWDHPDAAAGRTDAGGWWVVLPLWTLTECPSDLSAELDVDHAGGVTLASVHVM